MNDDHQHVFEAKYKREDSKMTIENPCKCTECDQLAFIRAEGYKVVVTLVPTCAEIRYSIVLSDVTTQQ